MDQNIISTDEAKEISVDDLLKKLSSCKTGISDSEVKIRLQQYGYNEITEKKVSPLAKFFIYFWGPIPWMIEVAAILSAIIHHWEDFLIISILLLVNAIVGFWQEHKADNADKSLKMSIVLQRFIPNISIISSNYSRIKGISWV